MRKEKTCVVDSVRLHILSEPRSDADVVCKVRYLTELKIVDERFVDDYMKVCTATGAEGYCDRRLVKIRK
jgi:hypothetical protein